MEDKNTFIKILQNDKVFGSYQKLVEFFNNKENIKDFPDGTLLMATYNDVQRFHTKDTKGVKNEGRVLVSIKGGYSKMVGDRYIEYPPDATIYDIDTNLKRLIAEQGSLRTGIQKLKRSKDIYVTKKSISLNSKRNVNYLFVGHCVSIKKYELYDYSQTTEKYERIIDKIKFVDETCKHTITEYSLDNNKRTPQTVEQLNDSTIDKNCLVYYPFGLDGDYLPLMASFYKIENNGKTLVLKVQELRDKTVNFYFNKIENKKIRYSGALGKLVINEQSPLVHQTAKFIQQRENYIRRSKDYRNSGDIRLLKGDERNIDGTLIKRAEYDEGSPMTRKRMRLTHLYDSKFPQKYYIRQVYRGIKGYIEYIEK